ncbi:serine hydrolase domain-containing protein [Litorilituus lipolyticus]|uniref:Class C beta-lactamase-related serine hydrolase n=1 Tax=Litorilituus lipolyticus TaxID=2491017 RepID=A0A502KTM5_9GAMM|nr:serine hydrolase [Litorilituus lipolyticus]TPH13421.1 class C beta-lactamase-related serine hydrolase [Litorilituus lipolyticus]
MINKQHVQKKCTRLIAIALLTGVNTFAVADSNKDSEKDIAAPMVSDADAKLSFWDMPYLENAYIDTSPSQRKDAIPVGKLGVGELDANNGNKEMIVKLAKEIANKQHGLIDSLLISHQGKLVFESYYGRGRVDLPHMQASSTKSYLSLAIGRAIQLGYLTMADLDKPLVGFLKDLDLSRAVEGADKITLHKAMSMRSGMHITRDQLKEFAKDPKQLKGQGQIQTYLEHSPIITSASQTFHYQGADPRLVMQVLEVVVPGTAKDFIQKELLNKMGITNYKWRKDASGLPMGPYGSSMTPRNMIKWGTLVMNNGKWNGEQLISESFIKKATNRLVHPDAGDVFFVSDKVSNPGYGYYFWQADMKVGNKNYYSQSAQGGGGQYIIMIEELDLLMVFTAHERDDKTMQIASERVLPAFVN